MHLSPDEDDQSALPSDPGELQAFALVSVLVVIAQYGRRFQLTDAASEMLTAAIRVKLIAAKLIPQSLEQEQPGEITKGNKAYTDLGRYAMSDPYILSEAIDDLLTALVEVHRVKLPTKAGQKPQGIDRKVAYEMLGDLPRQIARVTAMMQHLNIVPFKALQALYPIVLDAIKRRDTIEAAELRETVSAGLDAPQQYDDPQQPQHREERPA